MKDTVGSATVQLCRFISEAVSRNFGLANAVTRKLTQPGEHMLSDRQECSASGDHPDVRAVLQAIYNKTQEHHFQNHRSVAHMFCIVIRFHSLSLLGQWLDG